MTTNSLSCPKCSSHNVEAYGHYRDGNQRYHCRTCKRYFGVGKKARLPGCNITRSELIELIDICKQSWSFTAAAETLRLQSNRSIKPETIGAYFRYAEQRLSELELDAHIAMFVRKVNEYVRLNKPQEYMAKGKSWLKEAYSEAALECHLFFMRTVGHIGVDYAIRKSNNRPTYHLSAAAASKNGSIGEIFNFEKREALYEYQDSLAKQQGEFLRLTKRSLPSCRICIIRNATLAGRLHRAF